jgi:hypothetical protein
MATVAELKDLAKSLGIKVTGLKKADLEKAIDNAYKRMDGTPRLDPNKRVQTYTIQRNGGKLSDRQMRRVRKAANKAKK